MESDINVFKTTGVNAPYRSDVLSILERLLKNPDFDPSIDNNKAIILAAEFGRTDLVKLLLEDSRVNPAANYNDAIFRAAAEGWLDIVKLLLQDNRVDPSDRKNGTLRKVMQNYSSGGPKVKKIYKEIAKILLTDHRVEWRISQNRLKDELFREEENELKNILTSSYLSLNQVSPKIIMDGEEKNLLPKTLLKKISYEGVKNKLCSSNGNIPSMKLVALAKMLKIRYNSKTTKQELCSQINNVLKYML